MNIILFHGMRRTKMPITGKDEELIETWIYRCIRIGTARGTGNGREGINCLEQIMGTND